MTDVTDTDRDRARGLLDHTYCAADPCECSSADEAAAIAEALAEERAKARAPFLALAEEFDAESTGASVRANSMARTDENVRHHTAERRHARVAAHHASLIRHAAEESA